MLTIENRLSLLRALTFPLDAQLAALLLTRQEQLGGDIQGIARFILIQQFDRPSRVEEALGFSLFTNRTDGSRWGEPDYTPGFEFMEDHGFAYEFTYEFTTDFTDAIFLEVGPKTHPNFLAFCRQYATQHA